MKYDKAYFIAKFEAIPDEKWGTGACVSRDGRRCAIGHCGEDSLRGSMLRYGPEATALFRLLPARNKHSDADERVTDINDGAGEYQQPTPKARILAALRDLP